MTAPTTVTAWLDAKQALVDAATEGPWEHTGRNGVHTRVGSCVALSHIHDDRQCWNDAAFIADARTTTPALIAALRAVDALHETDESGWCNECDRMAGLTGRCDTVAAIASALGVSEP